MKGERFFTWLWSFFLAFLLAVGTAGCLATAFEFPLPWQAAAWLAAISITAAILCRFRFGLMTGLGLLTLSGLCLWRWSNLSPELDALVYKISRCYSSGYGWPVLGWMEDRDPALTITLPFILMGAFVALVTARVVARRGRTFRVIAAVAPFFTLCVILNDTVPAAPYLMAALFTLIMLLLTQSLRRRDGKQANRLTAMLTLPLVLGLAVLFVAVPREGYTPPPEDLAQRTVTWFQELEPGQKLVDKTMSFFSGLGKERISLKNTGPRGQQKYKVMEISAETSGQLYLRGRAYDVYDGKSWLASEGKWALDGDYQKGALLGKVDIRTNAVHNLLYFPVNTADSTASSLSGGHLDNPEGLTEYEMEWFHRYAAPFFPSRFRLSADGSGTHLITNSAEDLASGFAQQYLALPDSTREAALEYLEEKMPRFTAEPEDRDKRVSVWVGNACYRLPTTATADMKMEADFICELVRQSARYDLDTHKMPLGEEDFAMWFLRGSDTGYCVHFATAATVLLRAAGIPARYVEGYLVSAWENKTVAVLGEDAHAWVEYWIPGYGWQLLEATPGYGSGGSPNPTAPEETVPATTLPENTEPDPATRPDTSDLPGRPDVTRPDISGDDPTKPTDGRVPLLPGGEGEGPVMDLRLLVSALKWLAGFTLAFGALWGQWKLRLILRLRRLTQGLPNERALRYWRELGKMWKSLGIPPDKELENLALKARFSQHTLEPEELEKFTSCRAGLVAAMAGHSPVRRLWYRLVLAFY